MLGTHAFFLWSVRERIAMGDPDFTAFYTAGKMLREGMGSQLYNAGAQAAVQKEFVTDSDIRRGPLPYIHPPFEALVFLPLTFLPYSQAFALWNLLNLALLFGIASLLRNSVDSLRRVSIWQLVLIQWAFFPIFANFHQGQVAIVLSLVVTRGVLALDREKHVVAGCWLGLGLFKYHLILPLVLVLAIWKGRKILLGFAAVGSVGLLISLMLTGWQAALAYPAYAWRVVSQPGLGGAPPRQFPNLLGLLAGWPFMDKVGKPVHIAVLACSLALLVLVVRLRGLAQDPQSSRLYMASVVVWALLVGYSTNTYDTSLLVLPLALVADHCFRLPGKSPAKTSLIAPVIPILISPVWFFLWMRWERLNLIAIFLLWWLFAIRGEIIRLRVNQEALAK